MESREHNKKIGKYYTPQNYVSLLTMHVLEYYFKENKPSDISILDPACGDAIFLAEVINQLKNKRESYFKTLKIEVTGVDIDKLALKKAKERIDNCIDKSNTRKQLIHGDILINPKLLCKKKFDIIIGNPPWVSLLGKHGQNYYSKKKYDYITSRYPICKYRPNLFEAFIWCSFEILKNDGYLAFVVPDRLFNNSQLKVLQDYILKRTELKKLILNISFEKVVSDNIMFILQNKKPSTNNYIEISNIDGSFKNKMRQSLFYKKDNYKYLFLKKEYHSIIDKMHTCLYSDRLDNLYKSAVGFIGIKSKITEIKISINQKKIVTGRDIATNKILRQRYFEFVPENILGGTSNIVKLSASPKILLRKTGTRLVSTIDTHGYLPEQSLYFITSKNLKFEELLLLNRLLNSDLFTFYYLNYAVTNLNSTPHLKKSDIDAFPILNISLLNRPTPHEIGRDGLMEFTPSIKQYGYIKNPDLSGIESGCLTNCDNTQLFTLSEEQIYKFYGITNKEIELIEKFLVGIRYNRE
jgi:SAM-dependent methyltransferase